MCTRLLATLIRQWSDTPLLPYDLYALESFLQMQLSELSKEYKELLTTKHISLGLSCFKTCGAASFVWLRTNRAPTNLFAIFRVVNLAS